MRIINEPIKRLCTLFLKWFFFAGCIHLVGILLSNRMSTLPKNETLKPTKTYLTLQRMVKMFD